MSIPWGSKFPLTIFQKGGFEVTFELYEPLSTGEPDFDSPINFAEDTTAVAQCRKSERQDSDLVAEFTVLIDANKLTLSLTSEETEAIKVISGFYDVFVLEPDSESQMFVEGRVTINRAVSVDPVVEP